MILAVIFLPAAILLACLAFGTLFEGRFRARWWFLRVGLVPLICFFAAGYVITFPTPIPPDYDPMIHPNGGRLDFLAIVAWGLVLPLIYLGAALPLSFAYAFWKHARRRRTDVAAIAFED